MVGIGGFALLRQIAIGLEALLATGPCFVARETNGPKAYLNSMLKAVELEKRHG